jgi:hypothetical protein
MQGSAAKKKARLEEFASKRGNVDSFVYSTFPTAWTRTSPSEQNRLVYVEKRGVYNVLRLTTNGTGSLGCTMVEAIPRCPIDTGKAFEITGGPVETFCEFREIEEDFWVDR